MTERSADREEYFPIDQFSLHRDFLKNPLMSTVKLARFKFVAKMLSKNDSVLDLGCGNGYSSYYYSKFARKVVGVDLYADIPAISKSLVADNLEFVQADILDTPAEIREQSFTAITAVDVIEHFHQPDGERIIESSASMLPDGGMMILGTPSKFSGEYRSQNSRDIHFYEYEPEELQEICSAYFRRTLLFSMNDELVHTGFSKLAWFFFVVAVK